LVLQHCHWHTYNWNTRARREKRIRKQNTISTLARTNISKATNRTEQQEFVEDVQKE